ncbi:MAG: hypothetical protein FWE37_02075 [Spirochaetaceae bacterium]|nr:hypothetical protein [Spirochaetaceae bacterium]
MKTKIILLLLINYKILAASTITDIWRDIFIIDINPALLRLSSANFTEEPASLFTIQNFYNQTRLIKLALNIDIIGFNFYADLDFMQHFYAFKDNSTFSNLPFANYGFSSAVYSNIPLQGYLAYNSDLLQLSLGRRRWHLGAGDYNLVAGRDAPYFDGLWAGFTPQLPSGRFHFYFMAAIDDPMAIGKFLDWNRQQVNEADRNNNEHWFNLAQESRYFFVHQIAFSRDTWRVGLTESFIWQGQAANFFIANPFFLWHNIFNPEAGNVALTLNFEKLFTEQNIRLYAEASMDDLQLSWEPITSPPNQLALYVGADWQIFDNGERFAAPRFNPFERAMAMENFAFDGGLIVSFQALWASRYIWGRGDESALGKFTMFKDIHLRGNMYGSEAGGVLEHYLGFPYGGDNIYFKLSGQYQNNLYLFNGSLGFLLQGHEAARISGHYSHDDPTPQGVYVWGEYTAHNWVYSGVANFMLLLNMQAYYALSNFASGYISLNSRLILNRFSHSTVLLEIGAFVRF